MSVSNLMVEFLNQAKILGLPIADSNSAEELLENREYGLCFDTIVTQLYEYDIKIDENFYQKSILLCKQMGPSTKVTSTS